MAGKFLKRDAIIDTLSSERCMNAIRKREKMTEHPIKATSCGCPDPNCGAFHTIDVEHAIPSPEEADKTLAAKQAKRKREQHRKKAARKRYDED